MIHRCLGWIGAGALLTVLALATVPVAGQAPAPAKVNGSAAKAYTPPKTVDGQPDISGFWTNSTYIPLQRPEGVTKEFYTPEEMDKLEAAARLAKTSRRCPAPSRTCTTTMASSGWRGARARSPGIFGPG